MSNEAVPNSKEAVALALTNQIADMDPKVNERIDDPRTYYMTLYAQCLKVVSGQAVKDVLTAS